MQKTAFNVYIHSLKKVALITDIQGNVIQKWSTEIITQSIKINSFRHIRMNPYIHLQCSRNDEQFIHNANTRDINCFKASLKTPMFYSFTRISFKVYIIPLFSPKKECNIMYNIQIIVTCAPVLLMIQNLFKFLLSTN